MSRRIPYSIGEVIGMRYGGARRSAGRLNALSPSSGTILRAYRDAGSRSPGRSDRWSACSPGQMRGHRLGERLHLPLKGWSLPKIPGSAIWVGPYANGVIGRWREPIRSTFELYTSTCVKFAFTPPEGVAVQTADCRPPGIWDRHFASGMGPGPVWFGVAVADDCRCG